MVRHAMHTLKSSSANVGATLLSERFACNRSACARRRDAGAEHEWPEVRVEYARVSLRRCGRFINR